MSKLHQGEKWMNEYENTPVLSDAVTTEETVPFWSSVNLVHALEDVMNKKNK